MAVPAAYFTCKNERDLLGKWLLHRMESLFIHPLDQFALKFPQTTLHNFSPGTSVHSNYLSGACIDARTARSYFHTSLYGMWDLGVGLLPVASSPWRRSLVILPSARQAVRNLN
jgi:hypothetical protein